MTDNVNRLESDGWEIVEDISKNVVNIHKNETAPKPKIDNNWRKWIKENYERGCDRNQIETILKNRGFVGEDIVINMDFLWNDIFTIKESNFIDP